MFSKIIGTGSYVPEKTVTNDELASIMDTSDEWIRTRTGIGERHFFEASEKEKTITAALRASERALCEAEKKGLRRDEIDLVIAATCSPDYAFPATACVLSDRLSIGPAAAFDLSLACTGFLAAFSTASAYLASGISRNALVVGVDVMSKFLDMKDRSTAILFGDGAGALVLSADESFDDGCNSGVIRSILRSDGSRAGVLSCESLYKNENAGGELRMEGRPVFEFAVREVPKLIKELCEGMDEAPKLYVLHQANQRIIEAVAKRLSEPIDKFPGNIEHYANTTAATIPILLDELMRGGSLCSGDEIVMSGFGAGLSLGAILYRI